MREGHGGFDRDGPCPVERYRGGRALFDCSGFDLDELREKIESDLIDQFASEQQEMMTGRKQLVEITKGQPLAAE